LHSVFLLKIFGLNRLSKRFIQVSVDCLLIVICFVLAMYLRLDTIDFIYDNNSWTVLFTVVPITIFTFIRSGLYRAIIRFISSRALKVIILGCVVSSATMFITDQILVLPVPRSVPFIYSILMFCTIGGVRYALRTVYRFHVAPPKKNVIIYGAGHSGRQLLNSLDSEGKFRTVHFIDDNSELHGRDIGGVPVGHSTALGELINKFNVTTILLAVPSASANQRRRILNFLGEYSVEIKTMPAVGDLISGKSKVSELSFVEVDELLGRDAVLPDAKLISKNITDKVVLVSGAGGSIGSELCRQIVFQVPKILILLDSSEYGLYKLNEELEKVIDDNSLNLELIPLLGSIQDKTKTYEVFKTFEVDSIYHAAAYKHVPLVEQNVITGLYNNIFGTKKIVEASIEANVKSFTLVSTDKAVRPTNIMGATKRIAELICQAAAERQAFTKFSIVRFGNVLGSSGSVVPKFREQISSGGPVTVTDPEITRYFMTIPEAAQLVIQASAMPSHGDVFILDMGSPIKITNLVENMVRLHGLVPYYQSDPEDGDIEIKFTGLRPGEKLHEELFISGDPEETEHLRIFRTTEVSFPLDKLTILLDELSHSCGDGDIDTIRSILDEAHIGYTSNSNISDLVWNANN
jgi:FlaA1/EpsC-like NDP-sugar epimerase